MKLASRKGDLLGVHDALKSSPAAKNARVKVRVAVVRVGLIKGAGRGERLELAPALHGVRRLAVALSGSVSA